uniref:Uncharacterized protein n=1 Tax=Pithovirus LCPAC406 TaxID=2506599 RepID=A0A481ZIV8_9VIRU|nr:MAG: hypothetical protein LCPAC406_03750 [Pithovirus LCPAC406]
MVMDSSILKLVGELNKVFAYYTLDEYNIRECYYFAGKGISENRMLTTRCFLTVETLVYLFGAIRGENINKLSDNCTVALAYEGDFDHITHSFLYSEGYMYHSYAEEYTLKCIKTDKADISEMLNKLSDFSNSDNWEKLTGVRIPNLTGKCIVNIYNLITCDPNQIKTNAIILVNNALQALATGEGEHHNDYYTFILSLYKFKDNYIVGGIEYLNNLLSELL